MLTNVYVIWNGEIILIFFSIILTNLQQIDLLKGILFKKNKSIS